MKKEYMLGRKLIGTLENGIFRKEVLVSKHLFRVTDSFGIDSKTLHKLPEHTRIVLDSVEEGKLYISSKEEFLELGEHYLHFKNPQEDFKTQLFLKREHFRIEKPPVLTEDEKAYKDYKQMFL